MYFDLVTTELIDQVSQTISGVLVSGNDPAIGGFAHTTLPTVVPLLPEIVQHGLSVAGHQRQRRKNAGLHVVGVVTERPHHLRDAGLLAGPRPS